MSMSHLPPAALKALKKKRAIVFLENWNPPVAPGYLLSVVGAIDDDMFYASFMPDGFDGEIDCVDYFGEPVDDQTHLSLKSRDAMAVNRLWLEREGARRDNIMTIVSLFLAEEAASAKRVAARRKRRPRKAK